MPAYGNVFGKNLFGGGGQDKSVVPKNAFMDAIRRSMESAPAARQAAPGADQYMEMLQRLQTGGEATNRYREHVKALPERSAYAPSKLRSLGGALTAAAASFKFPGQAQELASQVTEAPYRQALSQWQLKGSGLKEQADIESQDIKNQTDRLEAMQKAGADWRTYLQKQEEIDVLRNWREAQAKHLGDSSWDSMYDPQGNLVRYNKVTGAQTTQGPSIEAPRLQDMTTRTGILRDQANTYSQAVAGYVPPATQIDAEAAAARAVVLANPQYKGWINPDGSIKTANDFTFFAPKADDPGWLDFMAKIEAEKRKILQMQRPNLRGLGGPPPPPRFGAPPPQTPGGPLKFGNLEE